MKKYSFSTPDGIEHIEQEDLLSAWYYANKKEYTLIGEVKVAMLTAEQKTQIVLAYCEEMKVKGICTATDAGKLLNNHRGSLSRTISSINLIKG